MLPPIRLFVFLVFAVASFLVLSPLEGRAQDSQKLTLDGDQDYATAPDSPEISFEGADNKTLTIEAWIKHDGESDADGRIFDKLDGNNRGYDLHLVGTGEEVPVQFTHGGNSSRTITSDTGVPAGRWTHVAVTYDGSTLSLYVNGELDRSLDDDFEIWDGNASPHVGTNESAGGNFFSGEIDELRIWDTNRTATEIRENRFTSLTGSESDLIAHYPFDSGAPTADQSGNGHTLVLEGDAATEGRDALPVPPDLYVEEEGNEEVRLRWEERTGPNGENEASGFRVYRSPPTGLSGRSDIAQPGASGSPTYTATGLSNGKTYFWEVTAEDGSGGESDFSPVMTGTPHDGTEPTPLKGGSALALDGTDDFGRVSDRPSLSVMGDLITIEAWIKHDGESDEDAIILHKRGSNGDGYVMNLVGSGEEVPIRFVHQANEAQGITSNTGIPAHRWTHVAVVSEAGEMRMYVDGELDSTVSDDKGIWDNDEPLRLGTNRTEDGRFFSGRIDDVRIWADARSEDAVQTQYARNLVGNESGLRGYFRFNDGRKGVRQDRSTGATERRAGVRLVGDAAVEGPGVFPLPPRLYAQPDSGRVELAWTERRSGEADQFQIYRDTSPDGSGRSSVTTLGATHSSYTDDGVSNATNTFHEITTINGAGQESDYGHFSPTTPSARYFGNALTLDGQGDYGTVGDRPSLTITGDSITVEAWVRHDGQSDEDAFILHKRGSNGYGYILRLDGSGDEVPVRFVHEANLAQGITSSTPLMAGEWTHVAVVSEADETRLYLNGELDNTVSDDKDIWGNEEPLRIGTNRTEDGGFFSGEIDEVRLWADARTESEIQNHYRRKLLGNEERLRGYWRFDETPGTVVSRAAAERPKTVALNGDADFVESFSFYPQSLTATVRRSFGSAASSSDYRLVALPGQVERPLADAISGEAGTDWQAYRDDGSDSEYLQKYDGSDAFTFEPGTGFWVTATSDWTEDVDVSTVSLRGDTAAVVGLNDGWNVVSNPLGTDVPVDAVAAANQAAAGGALQPLWGFDGTFSEADSMHSASDGRAYYFLNDVGLDSLRIPYPGAPAVSGKSRGEENDAPLLRVTAMPVDAEDPSGSTIAVGVGQEAVTGSGPKSVVAPPGRFEAVSLRIEAEEPSSERRRFLMRARRSIEDEGRVFDLRLTSRTKGPVALTARSLEAVAGREVRLIDASNGRSYDLREQSEVRVDPNEGEALDLELAVGTEAFVGQQAERVVPEEVALTSYPNPVREQGTLEYALPESGEVQLRVYDVLGREVATLVKGRKEAGRHVVRLETEGLSSGVYFGRLEAGEQRRTQKITVVR